MNIYIVCLPCFVRKEDLTADGQGRVVVRRRLRNDVCPVRTPTNLDGEKNETKTPTAVELFTQRDSFTLLNVYGDICTSRLFTVPLLYDILLLRPIRLGKQFRPHSAGIHMGTRIFPTGVRFYTFP